MRVLSNCRSTADEVRIDRFVKDVAAAEEFEEASCGRRKINTSVLLKDYSITMNNTDCGAGLGGRMTKYIGNPVDSANHFSFFFTFEIAAVNAFILYRGQNPTYKKGIREFAEQVIEKSVMNMINLDERCWIMRQYQRGIPGSRNRIHESFSRKPVSRLSKLQLRNEMGPAAPDPAVNYSVYLGSGKLKRKRASECMDMVPTKVRKDQKRRCFV